MIDWVETRGRPALQMAYHLGPTISADLKGHDVSLTWPTPDGVRFATVTLPSELQWKTHRGEVNPTLGWYSDCFGLKQPSITLLGVGRCSPGNQELRTTINF